MVVGAEELADVLELHRPDVVGRPNRHPVVRVVGRKERRHHGHHRQAVRPVLVVLPALVQHHVPLRLEALAGQRRQQVGHAIRFHPQRQIDGVGRDHFPVVGAIGVGRAVQLAAGGLERREVARVVMGRALEHQVLEEVREPGAPRLLVLRPDVVPEVHRDDRHVVVLVHDDVEPVGERAFRVGQVDDRRGLPGHRTGIRGILPRLASAARCADIDTCAAVRSATARKARAAGDAGSLSTSGTPRSLPSRIG